MSILFCIIIMQDATQYEQNVVDNNICEEFDNNKDDSPQEETLDSIQRKLYIPKQVCGYREF